MAVIYDVPTVLFLVWVFGMPLLAYASYLKIQSGKPLQPVRIRILSNIAMLILIALSACEAAASNHVHLRATVPGSAVAVGVFLLGVLEFGAWRGIKRRPERVALARRLFGTSNPAELAWAMVLAAAAGVGEELIFRGVLYQLAVRQFGSMAIALVFCVVLFALGHAAQGVRGIIFSAVLATWMHALVIVFDSIIVAMIVHTAYDAFLFAMLYQRAAPVAAPEASAATSA